MRYLSVFFLIQFQGVKLNKVAGSHTNSIAPIGIYRPRDIAKIIKG